MQAQAAAVATSEFPVAFGRYLLFKRLSRGGMGEIFLAKVGEIKGFEKFVIIKKILPQLSENQEFIHRFIDEVQIAIKLNHVNIAQVFEAGAVDKEYFLAIEYIEGRDLRRLLRRSRELSRRLPVDQCLYIARDLLAGLAYAHRRTGPKGQALSLVHCDISPPNLMISYEGEVKIIDFGIARSALRTADSNPNIGFGKFGYMAPEQLLRGGIIDRRTDIYAAGVLLYELLTGERLYQFPDGQDYRQMARMVCQGKFSPPSQRDARIDPGLDAIVCKALATRPEDRYQFAEEFRDALQQRLYQMSPTISADTLARTMDELFISERQHEIEELQQMRAVDAAAYREEIIDSVGHTTTIARALFDGHLTLRSDAGDEAPTTAVPQYFSGRSPIESAAHSRSTGNDTAVRPTMFGDAEGATFAMPLQEGFGRAVLYGLVACVTVVILGAGLWWRGRFPAPPRKIVPAAMLKSPAAPLIAREKRALEPLAPVFDGSAAVEPVAPIAPAAPTVAPQPVVAAMPLTPPARKLRPGRLKLSSKSEVASSANSLVLDKKRLEVDRKFQQIKGEYLEFRRHFGARLEDRWQEILSDIALGRRDQNLEAALDALRKEMRQARESPPTR